MLSDHKDKLKSTQLVAALTCIVRLQRRKEHNRSEFPDPSTIH